MNTDVSRREFLRWSMGGTMSIAGTLPNAQAMLISILGPESVGRSEGLSIDGSTLSLESGWKFRSGDDLDWAKPDLDDRDWTGIWPYYPLYIQNIDYQGYAWYRVAFAVPPEWKHKSDKLYLYLGRMTDTDQLYLNGQLLGQTGELRTPEIMPPNALADSNASAFNVRAYVFSTDDRKLNWNGKNVLAIRSSAQGDKEQISTGNKAASINDVRKTYTAGWREDYPIPRNKDAQLQMGDQWKFNVGDDPLWKNVDCDDSNWKAVTVGDKHYRDEVAWFRTQLVIPSSLKKGSCFNDVLVLDLGRLFDKVTLYLNGRSLEEYRIPNRDIVDYYPYPLECVYYVPASALWIRWDRNNVVATRVCNNHDWWGNAFHGGSVFVPNFFDLVKFGFNRLPYEIQARTPIDIEFTATSYAAKRVISATLEYNVVDRKTREVADTNAVEIDIYNDRANTYRYRFLPLATTDYLLSYKVTEKESGDNYARERLLGYKQPGEALRFTRQPSHWDHTPYDKSEVKWAVENKVKDYMVPICSRGQSIGGLLGERMRLNSEKALWGFVENFEVELLEGFYDRPKKDLAQGEFIGKYIHGMVRDLQYQDDESLRQRLDKVMDILIACIDPDGYAGTSIFPVRWLGLDVWEHKYVLYGLLYYYSLTGYEPALAAARKIGDLLCTTFGEEPGKLNIVRTGYQMGMQSTSILEPMVFLYRYTGEEKYLDFCTYIVRMWEKPYGPRLVSEMLKTMSFAETGNGKSYEQTSCYLGLMRYYQVTGDGQYLKALEYVFRDLAENRTNITGSNSERETVLQYICNGDIATWPCESCATAHWMQFCMAMFYLTGELKCIDEIERTTYNHLLASENPQTGAICYYSPLQNEKPFSYGLACCNSSLPRVIAMIPDVLWAQFADGGMAVLMYNQAKMGDFIQTVDAKRVFVDLSIQSEFPESGNVKISVNPASPAEFRLALRVPEWTLNFRAMIDGKALSGQPGKYLDLTRVWKAGDEIEISMDLNDQLLQGQSLSEEMKKEAWNTTPYREFFEKYGNFPNYRAIKHGPQVLAIDGFLSELDDAGLATLKLDQPMILQRVDDVLPKGWVGNQAYTCSALESPATKPVILVPFSDAGQTGGDIRVWIEKG